MSPHQIVAVATRLFAIWLFVLIAMNTHSYFLSTPLHGESDSGLVFIVGGALVVLLAFGLWKFPLTIAGKLLSSNVQEPVAQEQPDMWLAMGCALMGLWMIASTIPPFIQNLILFKSEVGDGYSENLSIWLVVYLPKTIIGFWLIFGGKGFRKIFWWARNAGRISPPSGADSSSD
jgi:hypothetical protein